MKRILQILRLVKEKTGVDVRLFSEFGVQVSGHSPRSGFSLPSADLFSAEGIYAATRENATYFYIESVPTGFYGRIKGCDAAALTAAGMIKLLAESGRADAETPPAAEEAVRQLLTGGLDPSRKNGRALFQDDPLNHYLLVLLTEGGEAKREELGAFLATLEEKGDFHVGTDGETLVFFKKKAGQNDYRSAAEFARVLYDNIKEEMRVELVLSTGPDVAAPEELKASYELALFAAHLGRALSPHMGLYDHREYVLAKLLSELPRGRIEACLDILIDRKKRKILGDAELMYTADEFLKNSLNISETSRVMYIHRNTLLYRLDKLESETGLNLRRFDDALVFRVVKILNRLGKYE